MDDKKRIMFSIEDDYYFVTIKMLLILHRLDCYKSQFRDYRKLSILFEIIKNDENFNFICRRVSEENLKMDLENVQKSMDIATSTKLNMPLIKRILFF